MVDNKGYDCAQRGGDKIAFIAICVKTRAKFKVDVTRKDQNGWAWSTIASSNGLHKLSYKVTVCSDGCGSMAHVANACVRMGMNHQYIPPHEQSLNEAEQVCDRIWAAARTLILHTGQSNSLMYKAVEYAMYVDLRMATGPSRGWLTPYEMMKGTTPNIQHLRPFNVLTFVTATKGKRIKLINAGHPELRAEQGRLISYHSSFSTTPCIMLTGNRLVHSINVTYDLESYRMVNLPQTQPGPDGQITLLPVSAQEALSTPTRTIDTSQEAPTQDYDDTNSDSSPPTTPAPALPQGR